MPVCRFCSDRYKPVRSMQPGRVCNKVECQAKFAEEHIQKQRQKQAKAERIAALQDRKTIRLRKEQLKTRQKWLAECQAIANKYARIRDAKDGCISCDKPASWDGQWHGSHFRSVGAASAVRFNLWNIHKACSVCNHHLSGNIAEYKPRLVEKIGAERVAWLESQNQLVRYEIDYLKKYKRVMSMRLRRMERRHGMQS